MCGSDNNTEQHACHRHMVAVIRHRHSNDRQHYRRSDRRYSRNSECYLYIAYRLPQDNSSNSKRIAGSDHRSRQRMCRQHYNDELYPCRRYVDDLRLYRNHRCDNRYSDGIERRYY